MACIRSIVNLEEVAEKLPSIPVKKTNKVVQKVTSFAKGVFSLFGRSPPGLLKTSFKNIRFLRIVELPDTLQKLVAEAAFSLLYLALLTETYLLAMDILGGMESALALQLIPGWGEALAACCAIGQVIIFAKAVESLRKQEAQSVLLPFMPNPTAFLHKLYDDRYELISKGFSAAGTVFIAVAFFSPGLAPFLIAAYAAKTIGGGLSLFKMLT